MKSPTSMLTFRAALLACALLACAAPAAQAVHWPHFGGDAGRSGYQPVDEGVTPVLERVWNATGPADRDVKTPIVTSTGSPASQRVIYGTSDGVVHFRLLASGAPLGPAAGTDIGDDADVFGTQSAVLGANGASVSFADTSTATGLGQLFAVHNEAPASRSPISTRPTAASCRSSTCSGRAA